MGIFKDNKGYPRWNNSGKLLHRTVASNMIGGSIGRGRVVQHRDGNKSNFKQNNLTVMSGRSHSSLHARKDIILILLLEKRRVSHARNYLGPGEKTLHDLLVSLGITLMVAVYPVCYLRSLVICQVVLCNRGEWY